MRWLPAFLLVASLILSPPVASGQSASEGHFEVEVEPVAYLLGGAGAHVGYQLGRWNYALEVFGLEVPEALHGQEDFSASPLGGEIHVERFFGHRARGFYAGPEVGLSRLTVTHEPTGAEETAVRYSVGFRGGYRWVPGLGDLYVSPVAGVTYTVNAAPVQLSGATFRTGPVTPFVTVGIGWSF